MAFSLCEHLNNQCRFNVVNLGCKVNKVESDSLCAALIESGAQKVCIQDASLVIVNSCTVTGVAEKKTRKAIRNILRQSPNAIVAVTGCSVSIDPNAIESLSPRVKTIPRQKILEEISSYKAIRIGREYRSRVSIKVQDGCNRRCSYCIVSTARGPSTSVPISKALEEAQSYLSLGVKELVLTGIDLGSYKDAQTGAGLVELCSQLLKVCENYHKAHRDPSEALPRIRISSLEPMSITEDFIGLMASSDERLCRQLHLPLQSGSTKVLKDMHRPYSAQEYLELVEHLYDFIPSLSLTTDIICGFPGESPKDFEETLMVAKACKFSKIHVFPYSKRPNTPAALRTDQIPVEVISDRAKQLSDLAKELRQNDLLSRSGTTELALVLRALALSESYHEVPIADNPEYAAAKCGSLISYRFP